MPSKRGLSNAQSTEWETRQKSWLDEHRTRLFWSRGGSRSELHAVRLVEEAGYLFACPPLRVGGVANEWRVSVNETS